MKSAESEILWKGFEDFFLEEGWEPELGELVIFSEVSLLFTMGENNRVASEFLWASKILLNLRLVEDFATGYLVVTMASDHVRDRVFITVYCSTV